MIYQCMYIQHADVGLAPLESATPLLADSLNGSGVEKAVSISKNVAEYVAVADNENLKALPLPTAL